MHVLFRYHSWVCEMPSAFHPMYVTLRILTRFSSYNRKCHAGSCNKCDLSCGVWEITHRKLNSDMRCVLYTGGDQMSGLP